MRDKSLLFTLPIATAVGAVVTARTFPGELEKAGKSLPCEVATMYEGAFVDLLLVHALPALAKAGAVSLGKGAAAGAATFAGAHMLGRAFAGRNGEHSR